MDIKIHIRSMQAPQKIKPQYSRVDIVEKVEQYIHDINSNIVDSEAQWKYLQYMYKLLGGKKKLSEAEQCLLKMIAPEIEKHTDGSDLDSATMFRYLEDEK